MMMMWISRMLFAPEGAEGSGGGGEGAGVEGEGAGSTDVIPRSEAVKAFAARDQAKEGLRTAEAENAKLREQLDAKTQPGAKPQGGDETPAWATKLLERVDLIDERITGKERTQQRTRAVEQLLEHVPENNRGTARHVLAGLESAGELKLDGSEAMDVALAKLKQNGAALFMTPGSGNSALQAGADGAFPWDQVKSAADIPQNMWAEVPDEVMARLGRGASGDDGGILMLGGSKS